VARRAFKVIDVIEILVHWHAGRRIGELSSSLGVDPKTVRKYVAPAVAAGLAPGGPSLSGPEWSKLVEGWIPELVDRAARQSSWPEIEAHREAIKAWLGQVTISTIHQRLRDDCVIQRFRTPVPAESGQVFRLKADRGTTRERR
jgi:hypothetical protein